MEETEKEVEDFFNLIVIHLYCPSGPLRLQLEPLVQLRELLQKNPKLLNAKHNSRYTGLMLALTRGDVELLKTLLFYATSETDFLMQSFDCLTYHQYFLRNHYPRNNPLYIIFMRAWIKIGCLIPILIQSSNYMHACYDSLHQKVMTARTMKDHPEQNPNMHRSIALYQLINKIPLELPPELMVMLTTCLSQSPEKDLLAVKKLYYD